jgi:hypothetical protein
LLIFFVTIGLVLFVELSKVGGDIVVNVRKGAETAHVAGITELEVELPQESRDEHQTSEAAHDDERAAGPSSAVEMSSR